MTSSRYARCPYLAIACANEVRLLSYRRSTARKGSPQGYVASSICSKSSTDSHAPPTDQIPPHGRWRHLDAGAPRVDNLLHAWSTAPTPIDTKEQARRAIDLFIASVLLDAGAGNVWKFEEKETRQTFSRSEGLGVASFRMFESGLFSSVEGQPYRVDGMHPAWDWGSKLIVSRIQQRDCPTLLRRRWAKPCRSRRRTPWLASRVVPPCFRSLEKLSPPIPTTLERTDAQGTSSVGVL